MTDEQALLYDNYIYYIIAHYYNHYPEKEDLFQVGRIGLLDAYAKYDPTIGVKFTTYAFPFIRGEMSKYIQSNKGMKVSRSIQRLKLLIERATIILSQQFMRIPTILELSEYLNIKEEEISYAMQVITTMSSIDEPICMDGKEMTLHDTIASPGLDMDTQILVKESIHHLTPCDQELFKMRYLEGKTQSEIAEELGTNQVQVSRKIKKMQEGIYQKIA